MIFKVVLVSGPFSCQVGVFSILGMTGGLGDREQVSLWVLFVLVHFGFASWASYYESLCMRAKSLQSLSGLWPVDCSPPGSDVHGILQSRLLEWVATPSSRGSFLPRDETGISYVSCTGRWVLCR